MDRRFFVLTHAGEQGPFTPDDLRREVLAGTISPSDVLRTAMGKASGTVGELLGPQARVASHPAGGSHASGGVPVGRRSEPRLTAPKPRRSSSDGRLQPGSHSAGQRDSNRIPAWVLPLVAVGLVAVTALIAVLATTKNNVQVHANSEPASLPTITMQAAHDSELIWSNSKPGFMILRSSVPVLQDTVVRLQWSGTGLAGVATQPVSILIPAGQDQIRIEVLPTKAIPTTWERREVVVTLQPDPAYLLGSKIFDRLSVQGASALSSVAYEPFAYESNFKLTSLQGGFGWAGAWHGDNVEMSDGTVALPNQARDFGRSVRIWTMSNRSALTRSLKNRIDTGELWISFRGQFFREEGYNDGTWGGVQLLDGEKPGLFMGKNGAHWGIGIEGDPAPKPDGNDLFEPVFLVYQISLANGRGTYRQWRNPPAGPQAPVPSVEVLDAPGFGVDGLRLIAEDNCSVQIDELRLGRSFAEVVPAPR